MQPPPNPQPPHGHRPTTVYPSVCSKTTPDPPASQPPQDIEAVRLAALDRSAQSGGPGVRYGLESGTGWSQVRARDRYGLETGTGWGQVRAGVRYGLESGTGWRQVRAVGWYLLLQSRRMRCAALKEVLIRSFEES